MGLIAQIYIFLLGAAILFVVGFVTKKPKLKKLGIVLFLLGTFLEIALLIGMIRLT